MYVLEQGAAFWETIITYDGASFASVKAVPASVHNVVKRSVVVVVLVGIVRGGGYRFFVDTIATL